MSKTILITGGARSGKSAVAERMTTDLGPAPIYIATSEVRDAELAARVAAHLHRRGTDWTTIEEPLDVVGALRRSDGAGPRLLDCLTLWLSNLMLGGHDWKSVAHGLAAALPDMASPVVIVTNEVGAGIVPENRLAREFRDAAGEMNQVIAAASDDVYLAVAGQTLKVK